MKTSFKKLTIEKVLLFLLFFGLFVIIPINLYLLSQNKTKNASPVPTTSIPQSSISPSVKQIHITNTPDSDIKTNILSELPAGESGILYESSVVRIDYVHSADVFQVEVLTTDVEQAKLEAITWFMHKGADQKEICGLAIQFYPSFEVKNALKESNKTFNPLLPGC